MTRVENVRKELRRLIRTEEPISPSRFFKTGPGEYAEGDKFLGVSVPNLRTTAKQFQELSLEEVEQLLTSKWHEERLVALLILVRQYAASSEANKKAVYDFYMAHTAWINNWDLVDSSSEFIVGPYLQDRPKKMTVLCKLAASDSLWERRIAMLATFHYVKQGKADEAVVIAEKLLYDAHDLIQKAVGWMLRETGKRVEQNILISFLDKYAATMPRTTLRYAIEQLPSEQREQYLSMKKQ